MIPLSTWLARGETSKRLCRRADGDVGRDAFLADVAALAHVLEKKDRGGRWILCTESAYACAVGLLAAWQCENVVVLPPNLEAGSLRELADGARGVLGVLDDPDVSPSGLERVAILGHEARPLPRWRELDRECSVLELCTSGSTGTRKVVAKTFDQLEAEIESLEHEFGAKTGGTCVIGTVSFQHIYGLLFRVLWPLCAGRSFADESIVDPARIASVLDATGRGVLVSSPAHLKRLPELLDLARLRPTCAAIFSSGGALDEIAARRIEEMLGFAPIEVLGSTETGGIAWRVQSAAADGSWSPFPGVRVEKRDGLLHVTSRPAGAHGGVTTGDAIELLPGGRFQLLGRADRIVKLFDERVSLVELETRLAAHPLVRSAAAFTLERNGTSRIAAVVVPSAAGLNLEREQGKTTLVAELQTHLRAFFRATVVPRSWRFVERLPEDAQGKIGVAALEALFEKSEPVRAAKLVSRAVSTAEELELELEVPRDLWALRGHFDDMPVVAGVVQLQWVIEWTASLLGFAPDVRGVEALKFKQLLLAGDRFRLRLERTSDAGKVRFRLWNERGEFSSGRMLIAAGTS